MTKNGISLLSHTVHDCATLLHVGKKTAEKCKQAPQCERCARLKSHNWHKMRLLIAAHRTHDFGHKIARTRRIGRGSFQRQLPRKKLMRYTQILQQQAGGVLPADRAPSADSNVICRGKFASHCRSCGAKRIVRTCIPNEVRPN
jgi:hypothetical protein